MTINPGGIVLLVIGVAAVIIGVRGSQAKIFAAITGKEVTPNPIGGAGVGSAPFTPTAPTTTAPAAFDALGAAGALNIPPEALGAQLSHGGGAFGSGVGIAG